jgi:hypothetical protein
MVPMNKQPRKPFSSPHTLGFVSSRSLAFGELRQHAVVHVVVDEDDGFFRLPQQVVDEHVGVEDLAVEKDALDLLGEGVGI